MTREWWTEDAGLFGDFYMEGDASLDGHLSAASLSLSQRTHRESDGVMRLLGLKQGSAVLDVPCGYGRHAIELAARGCEVLGVDLNGTHLDSARQASLTRWPEGKSGLEFRQADMLTLDYAERFDAVINMFFSFGFFASEEENMRVLRNFRNAARPGGRFLMHTDVNMPRIWSGKYKTRERRLLASGATLVIEERYVPATRRIEGSWTIEGRGAGRKQYSVRVYEADEFGAMCLKAGFLTCEVFGNWDGGPYGAEVSEDVIFVARRTA